MGDATHNLEQLSGREFLYLRPEEILERKEFNVRPWSGRTETEDREIEDLANRIELLGQLDPVRVIPGAPVPSSASKKARKGESTAGEGVTLLEAQDAKESYYVYAGSRRRRAIALINQRRSAKSNGTAELLRVWCVVDRASGDIRQKAFSSNRDRKNMSPMDVADFIHGLRQEEAYGPGAAGTAKIAKYLGVSKAQVTQHERLLSTECSKELQHKLQDGTITLDTAFEIMNSRLEPDKQAKVVERAKEIQNQDAMEEIAAGPGTLESKQKKLDEAGKKKRVEAPAIRKALKEAKDQGDDVKVKRGLKDVKEFFEGLDGPAYGHANGAVRVFTRYFVDSWLTGEGTDRTLEAKFDAMVEKADKGTAAVKEDKKSETKADKSSSAPEKSASKSQNKDKNQKKDGDNSKKQSANQSAKQSTAPKSAAATTARKARAKGKK